MAGKNVLGTELQSCSEDPMTGFYRDGCCNTGAEDRGLHTVCVRVNAEFLSSVDPLEMICPHLCRSMHFPAYNRETNGVSVPHVGRKLMMPVVPLL